MARTDLPAIVLISVGNTRTRVTIAESGELEPSRVVETVDAAGVAAAAAEFVEGRSEKPAVLLASVNEPGAEAIEAALTRAGFLKVTRFGVGGAGGDDVPVPIEHSLDSSGAKTVGQDRLLDALGAYARSDQACIVIDAGTAITVDFVDGTGVFTGGAIAPGVRMMLRAMHEGTGALPSVELNADEIPGEGESGEGEGKGQGPFGKNTKQAMLLGAVSAARGLVRLLVDRYAEFYGAYPRVVATGGDAPLLFAKDPLVEAIVPDLTLVGMLAAYERLASLGDEDEGLGGEE